VPPYFGFCAVVTAVDVGTNVGVVVDFVIEVVVMVAVTEGVVFRVVLVPQDVKTRDNIRMHDKINQKKLLFIFLTPYFLVYLYSA